MSGINDGYNLGSDVFYSGTVAGAVEGALRGGVGMALSMAPNAPDPQAGIAICAAIVRAAIGARLPNRTVLNVNTPGTAERRNRPHSDPRLGQLEFLGGQGLGRQAGTAEIWSRARARHRNVVEHGLGLELLVVSMSESAFNTLGYCVERAHLQFEGAVAASGKRRALGPRQNFFVGGHPPESGRRDERHHRV